MEEYPRESDTESETVGFTDAGIAQDMVFVFVPMLVSPVNVSMVNTTLTLVPVVFCAANVKGGVHEMLVLPDFVATVPLVLPHLYVIVCVKFESYRLTVKVCAVPSVPFDAVKLLFLAMVGSVPLPDPDFVPMLEPLKVIPNS